MFYLWNKAKPSLHTTYKLVYIRMENYILEKFYGSIFCMWMNAISILF